MTEQNNNGGLRQSTRTVAKNASFLLSSQLVTWLLALVLTFYMPRLLGPRAIGQLHIANSLWAIGSVIVAFGINTLLTKDIARDAGATGRLFGQAIYVRVLLYLVAWIGILGYLLLFDILGIRTYPVETLLIIVLIGFSIFPRVFGYTARASLQGLERMEYISIADIAAKTFNVVVIMALLLLGQKVLIIACVAVFTSSITLLVQLFYLRRLTPLSLRFDLATGRGILRASLPFFYGTAFGVAYQQVDAIVISIVADETVVGWYGTADRLFSTLLFVPTVLTTAVFPLMSRLHEQDPATLGRLMRRSFGFLLVFSVPIGLGIVVIAQNAALLIYGEEFREVGPVLAVFGIVTILTYQNVLLGRFAFATDRQTIWAWIMGIAAIATIPLDLWLVPLTQSVYNNGAIGGAVAYIFTEGLMFVVGLYVLSRDFLDRSVVEQTMKVLLAGGIMVAVTWVVRDLFLPIPMAVGAISYGGAALLLRVLPPEDMAQIRQIVNRVLKRVRR